MVHSPTPVSASLPHVPACLSGLPACLPAACLIVSDLPADESPSARGSTSSMRLVCCTYRTGLRGAD
jgi:hypothetical protein